MRNDATDHDNKSKRVTIRDVATEAEVSPAAVSKVLTGASGVSDALRSRVEAAISKLDYRPLPSARAMRGRAFTIGVLLPDIRNAFFAEIMSGINSYLGATRYHALIGVGDSETEIEHALLNTMIDRRVDGLILIGTLESTVKLGEFAKSGPMVAVGHLPSTSRCDTVNGDDFKGAAIATRHLAAQGYNRIAMMNLRLNETSTILSERERGYRETMTEIGRADLAEVAYHGSDNDSKRLVIRELLSKSDRPDAIFCWTDSIALEVISVASRMGIRVPQELGVVGYDNTGACDLFQNALTSVEQHGHLLGSEAARLLIERIEGRVTAEHFVATPTLVRRRSSERDYGMGITNFMADQ